MKNTFVAGAVVAGVVVALVLSYLAFTKPFPTIEFPVGAVVSSQALQSPVCADGRCVYTVTQPIANTWAGGTGTTTPCAIRNPANATTTLLSLVFQNNVATGTAAKLSIATSSTAFATGTTNALIRSDLAAGVFDIAASVQKTYNFVPVRDTGVVGPGQFVVVGAQGSTGVAPDMGFQWTGTCSAKFEAVK